MPPASETLLIMSAERTGFYSLGVEVSDCTPRKILNEKQCENQCFCNDTATVQPSRNYYEKKRKENEARKKVKKESKLTHHAMSSNHFL